MLVSLDSWGWAELGPEPRGRCLVGEAASWALERKEGTGREPEVGEGALRGSWLGEAVPP